jgi:hypothetical protein
MPSINLDLDFPNHPKVKRLVGLLGRGADILPIRLWLYVGKYHAEHGQLIGYSPQEIETQVEWWGKAGACMDALIKVGLLDAIEGGYQVHDWRTHAGHIHALKLHAVNMNQKRWAKYRGDPDRTPDSNPTRTPIGTPNKEDGYVGRQEDSEGGGGAGEGDEPFDPANLPKMTQEGRDLLRLLRSEIAATLIWAEDIAKHPSTANKALARHRAHGKAFLEAMGKAYEETGDRSIAQLIPIADKSLKTKPRENLGKKKYEGNEF